MVLIFLYFSAFLLVSSTSQVFASPGIRKMYQLVLCFLLLFVFFGFRDITVLNDTPHYYGHYYQKTLYTSYRTESVFTFHLLDRFEYGYQVLVHVLIKYVSTNPYTIILVSSLLVTLGDLWFISKYSRDVAMVCFFFLISNIFFMHYCIIRQSFALIIFYVAFGQLEKGRHWRYALLILLAAQFHSSAYLLLALPLLMRLRMCRRNVILVFLSFIVLSVLIFQILSLLGLRDNFYYKKAIQRETISLVGLIDFAVMAMTTGLLWYVHRKTGARHMERPFFWICVLAMGICFVLPVFYALARINEFLWPFIIVQLLRTVAPQCMKAPTTTDSTSADDAARPAPRQLRIVRTAAHVFMVALFVGKMLGMNAFRPEWLHVDDYRFYDFGKRYHYYQLYPQEE